MPILSMKTLVIGLIPVVLLAYVDVSQSAESDRNLLELTDKVLSKEAEDERDSKVFGLLNGLINGQKQLQKSMERVIERQNKIEAALNKLVITTEKIAERSDRRLFENLQSEIRQVGSRSNKQILNFLRASNPVIRPQAAAEKKQMNVSVSYASVKLYGQCSLVLNSSGGTLMLAHNTSEDVSLSWVHKRSKGLTKDEISRIKHYTVFSRSGYEAVVVIRGLVVPGSSVTFRFSCNWLGDESYEDVTINVVPELVPAIDIGTSGICAAYVDANRAVQLINLAGDDRKEYCIPSVVWLCSDGIRVGFGPWTDSKSCTPVYDLKRQLGSFCEIFRLSNLGSYPGLLAACGERRDESPLCNLTAVRYPCEGTQDRQLQVDTIMGTVAKVLVGHVERNLGIKQVRSVAFSFPPEFRASQRAAFYDIIQIANQSLSLHLPEPMAAVAYLLHQSELTKAEVLVIDIGHGTTGIQLVAVHKGLRAMYTGGFPDRGGRDIDIFIQNRLSKDNPERCSPSLQAVEALKIALSKDPFVRDTLLVGEAPLPVENKNFHLAELWNNSVPYCQYLNNRNSSGVLFGEHEVQHDEESKKTINNALMAILDLACKELFGDDLPDKLDQMLLSKEQSQSLYSEKSYPNVDKVYIVGGASHIPCLQRIIRKHFEERNPNVTLSFTANSGEDPKAVVAMGSAIQAAKLSKLIPVAQGVPGLSTHNSLRLRGRDDRCHQVIPAQSRMDDIERDPIKVALSLKKQRDGRKCIDLHFCESGVSQTLGGHKEDLVTDCTYCVPVRLSQDQRLCPKAIPSGYNRHVVAEVRGVVYRNASMSVRLSGLWTESGNAISGDSGTVISKIFSSDSGHFLQNQIGDLRKIADKAARSSGFSCSDLPVMMTEFSPMKFCDRNYKRLLKVTVNCYHKANGKRVGDMPVDEDESLTVIPEEADVSCKADVAVRHPAYVKKGPTALVIIFEQNSATIVEAITKTLSSYSFQNEETYIALLPFHNKAIPYFPLTKLDDDGRKLLANKVRNLDSTKIAIILRDSLVQAFDLIGEWLQPDFLNFSRTLPDEQLKFGHLKTVVITTGHRDDDSDEDGDVWSAYSRNLEKSPLVSSAQIAVQYVESDAPAYQMASTKTLLSPSLCEGCISYVAEDLSAAAAALRISADLDEVDNVLAADVELEITGTNFSALQDGSAFIARGSVSSPHIHAFKAKRFGFTSLFGEMLGSTHTSVEFSVPVNATEDLSVIVSLRWRQLSPSVQDHDDDWLVRRQKMAA